MSSRREPVKLSDIGLVLLTLVTIGIVVLALRTPEPPLTTATDTSPVTPTDSPTDGDTAETETADQDQPLVVVLGDSFTNGGEEFGGQTWTELVAAERGWTIEANAPGGSGFVTPGGGRPMPERVDGEVRDYAEADLWVVAAGASDIARTIPTQEVVDGAAEVLDAIEAGSPAPIVLVSPFAVAAPGEPTLELRDALQGLCDQSSRCTYVDATSWFDQGDRALMDPTGSNPTQEGQRVLSRRFLEVLPELGE